MSDEAVPYVDRTQEYLAAMKGEGTFEKEPQVEPRSSQDDIAPQGSSMIDAFFTDSDESLESDSQSTEQPEQDLQGDASTSPEVSGEEDIEEIVVRDDQGRRKVKVDWNNRDDIKKKLKLAAGARRWQSERDQARSQLKKLEEPAKLMGELEEAYQTRGVEGVIDRIEGREGAYQDYINKQIERHQLRENASPQELALLDKQEAYEKQQARLKKLEEDHRRIQEEQSSKEAAVQERELRNTVEPVFNQYRFAGKLGNPDQEQMLDQMVWSSALKKLEPYEDRGDEITSDMVRRAFRSSSNSIRKMINLQSEKKVQKVIKKKKQDATEHAQRTMQRGQAQSKDGADMKDMLRKGDLSGFIKQYASRLKI